jgi:hypothetical protein
MKRYNIKKLGSIIYPERRKEHQLMKILKYMALVSIFLLLPVYGYTQPLGSLRFSLVEGDVQVMTEDAGEWVPASINMPLVDGDRIWVPEGGRAELHLRDGTFLRLDENSSLDILAVENDSFQFYLAEGRSYTNFRGLKGSLFQIDTPVSSIRVYDRSKFRIDVALDGYTDISVYRGYVYAENRDGRTRVDAGKTLSISDGTYPELSPLPPPDEWERWNKERDRRLVGRRPPSRYLPDELQSYSSDFEENGRWVSTSDYGYVWTPTVIVSVGWAPYRIGRWVWIRGDYVWVSYEPWGWVPYHYGRWAFIASIGWCWVPPPRGAVYWGPGYVGWVYTPTYVSWVPLAPREIYYGYGYYGPHSVNITQINITHIDIHKVVYKNVHVHNAVTVIHHDTFVKGKQVEVKVRENLFLKEKISIGRPDIKPEKATFMPIVKDIPQAKRPPEPIREIRMKGLKEKRPLVREKESSVFRPGSPSKEMQLKVREGKPPEKGEPGKPAGIKKPEREKIEKPKVIRPSGRGPEIIKESRPPERGVEKRPVEKEVEKPKEFKPAPRGTEPPKESKPVERGIEKPREMTPPERAVEKTAPAGKGIEKPREGRPPGGQVEKQGERKQLERKDQRQREPKEIEKEKEKSQK